MWLWSDPLVTIFVRSFLALLFAGAAYSKLRHQEEFYGVVRNFRLMPDWLAYPFAMILPWLELAVAVGLVVDRAMPVAAVAASSLLIVFALAIAINVARGRKAIDCGCFRTGYRQNLSWLLVLRNVLLAGAGLILVLAPQAVRTATVVDFMSGVLAALVAMTLYFTSGLLTGVANTARNNGHLV
ncbi:Methylamine utilization protein MauE [Candidatus Filomicrobium marinum]|uniref:Methylamine utilization protein MauE n=2 Tax=Filomicrobium TaxID=119044 RepID=A0A0D6JK28_9HYPH|nr:MULTISPECIES: MauE/DoxX family redox-associated membrane protein [Filomicrobium]CFX58350.1 Methylamine utilization protein MauE [Candidatus Filomicrobium marinum]CPR22323.1 Methylamine utilization protein MauE [Candidatus Filomicrobium marinum]SDO88512.1 Methylamine utilisation protein MauE [Filomicrobium insigne]